MMLKQAKIAHWKKWAAKHECEELKEGVWLEPIQAMLRRRTNEAWDGSLLGVSGRWSACGWSVV